LQKNTPFNVVAVIVTYNRCELLQRCLAAIRSQQVAPHAVLVIDNAGSDGTEAFMRQAILDDPRVHYVRLPDNVGGSGGFHEGIKRAQPFKPDWLWLMDDDTIPSPAALEVLLKTPQLMEPTTGYVCSRVIGPDGDPCGMNIAPLKWEWPFAYQAKSDIFLVQNCSFVSVLIRNSAVQLVGLPIREFFIWWDDVEYTLRLSRIFKGFLNYNSVVTHLTKDAGGDRLDLLDDSNLWKYRCGIRNKMAVFGRGRGRGETFNALLEILHLFRRLFELKKPWRFVVKMGGSAVFGLLFFNVRKKIEFLPSDEEAP
jgi:GT2 family glycosyltransferase